MDIYPSHIAAKRCLMVSIAYTLRLVVYTFILVVSTSVTTSAAEQSGENIALAKPYTLWSQPSYPYCSDADDRIQLTDGKSTKEYFWTQQGTVGWSHPAYSLVTVDLGPFDFPRQTTLHIGGWSYTNGGGTYGITADNLQEFLRHIQSHFVNAPWATSAVMMKFKFDPSDPAKVELDTQQFDNWIEQWPNAKRYHVFL